MENNRKSQSNMSSNGATERDDGMTVAEVIQQNQTQTRGHPEGRKQRRG